MEKYQKLSYNFGTELLFSNYVQVNNLFKAIYTHYMSGCAFFYLAWLDC